MPRKSFRRRPARKFPKKTARVKKMVGEQPSLVDKIASGVGQVAKLAGAIAPIVAAINTEEKYVDYTSSVTFSNASPQIINLTRTAQSLTDTGRIGDSVKARFLQIRNHFVADHSTVNNNIIRCMIFVDKSVSASMGIADPTLANLFTSSTNVFSPLNKDNGDRFVLLKDKIFTLDCPTATNAVAGARGGSTRFMKINLPLDFHIRYVAANLNDVGPNQVYMLLWTASGVTPSCTYYSRFKYTDN